MREGEDILRFPGIPLLWRGRVCNACGLYRNIGVLSLASKPNSPPCTAMPVMNELFYQGQPEHDLILYVHKQKWRLDLPLSRWRSILAAEYSYVFKISERASVAHNILDLVFP